MSSTTTGVKLDPSTKDRIKQAARVLDRTPHWFMKKAIVHWLEKIEAGAGIADLVNENELKDDEEVNSVERRHRHTDGS